jgi:hypothetical protein
MKDALNHLHLEEDLINENTRYCNRNEKNLYLTAQRFNVNRSYNSKDPNFVLLLKKTKIQL